VRPWERCRAEGSHETAPAIMAGRIRNEDEEKKIGKNSSGELLAFGSGKSLMRIRAKRIVWSAVQWGLIHDVVRWFKALKMEPVLIHRTNGQHRGWTCNHHSKQDQNN